MTPFDLHGRVALVTGAAGLLGQQHCRALAAVGADLVLTDLESVGLDELQDALRSEFPVVVRIVAADIADEGAVDELARSVQEQFGRLDVLVNNAAIDDKVESPLLRGDRSRFEEYPVELWRRTLDVNLTGTFLCCQRLGRLMVRAGRGSIINIASMYGIDAPCQALYREADLSQKFHKSAAYPVSKAGVIQLTRFLASYWGRAGIRVNALSPGGIQNGQSDTFRQRYAERVPLGRMALPSELQGALLFLATDASTYVTGANLVVDGGWTIW